MFALSLTLSQFSSVVRRLQKHSFSTSITAHVNAHRESRLSRNDIEQRIQSSGEQPSSQQS